jgi:D-threo-aldose 1-dehydrogenase
MSEGRRRLLPRIGFGTSGIAGLYQAVSAQQAGDVLDAAWASGMRYFDTAPHYGQGKAERLLGDFLRDKPPGDYLISTKVGRMLRRSRETRSTLNAFVDPLPFDQAYDYGYDGVMRSVEDSYQRLGLSRIDLLFVHEIGRGCHGADNERHQRDLETGGWRALEELRRSGEVAAIGLGVNEVEVCLDLLPRLDIDVILLAGRYTLLDRTAADRLLGLCEERSVAFVAAGIFSSGILALGNRPGAHFDYGPVPDAVGRRVDRLEAACRAHGVPLAAAALHMALREPRIGTVLLSAATREVVAANAALLNARPPDAVWPALEAAAC